MTDKGPDFQTPKGTLFRRREIFPSGVEMITAVLATETWSDRTLQVRSYAVALGGVLISFVCLAIFYYLQEHWIVPYSIEAGYPANSSTQAEDLKILDLRNGFSTLEVIELLNRWGQKGRLSYITLAFTDMLCFQIGYRITMMVILNNVVAKLSRFYPYLTTKLNLLCRLPLYLAKVDVFETVLNILVVSAFELFHLQRIAELTWFGKLVRIASALNQLKWLLAKCLGGMFLMIWTAVRIGSIASRGGAAKKEN